MKITIDVREEWIFETCGAMGDEGNNDGEHDLLFEIATTIQEAVILKLRKANDNG